MSETQGNLLLGTHRQNAGMKYVQSGSELTVTLPAMAPGPLVNVLRLNLATPRP